MTPQYFPLLYRLYSEERYLIWSSNDEDALVVGADGLIPSFKDIAQLRAYADVNCYRLQNEEPILHDLDWVAAWTKAPVVPIDCVKALAAWNLFSDVARSMPDSGTAFQHLDSRPAIYDKLFWGNNLPSMTPEGRNYVPEWFPDEVALLAETLCVGFNLFESCTRRCPQDV
jgi:hypothetical protein